MDSEHKLENVLGVINTRLHITMSVKKALFVGYVLKYTAQ